MRYRLHDRVEAMLAENPNTTAALLVHVLAHEIAHVLTQATDHSDAGILKGRWSPTEIRAMSSAPLRFTVSDVLILRDSIPAQKWPEP